MLITPLLAAGNDWIVGLVTLAIPVVIWVFNRVMGQMNQPGPQRPQQQRGRRIPPAGTPKPDDEVQEFLRRVRERRREAETVEVIRPPQRSAPAKRAASQEPARGRSAHPGGQSRAAKEPQAGRAEPLATPQAAARPRLESRIADHVSRDIDTSDVTGRTAQLTKLDQADEQMEAHIKSAFTHKLGQLDSTAAEEEAAAAGRSAVSSPSSAAAIRAILASPDDVRRGVIMREILDRPIERW